MEGNHIFWRGRGYWILSYAQKSCSASEEKTSASASSETLRQTAAYQITDMKWTIFQTSKQSHAKLQLLGRKIRISSQKELVCLFTNRNWFSKRHFLCPFFFSRNWSGKCYRLQWVTYGPHTRQRETCTQRLCQQRSVSMIYVPHRTSPPIFNVYLLCHFGQIVSPQLPFLLNVSGGLLE